MKYLVAVSGGVDSVVLLDLLSRTEHELVVAHVDHGIRTDSSDDARFVEALARRYDLPFVGKRVELGAGASEEAARQARYKFLYQEADKLGAVIVTAHHIDDLVETIAINLERGTGWRGLASMSRKGIWRPLIVASKSSLYDYAVSRGLEWVEDSTNRSLDYQRNRLRYQLTSGLSYADKLELLYMWVGQLAKRQRIDKEVKNIIANHGLSRYFLTQIDERTAMELLGSTIVAVGGVRPTRPRLKRALLAVKTAKPGASHQVGDGVTITFDAKNYSITVV